MGQAGGAWMTLPLRFRDLQKRGYDDRLTSSTARWRFCCGSCPEVSCTGTRHGEHTNLLGGVKIENLADNAHS
jgi:hypothetical protein